MSEFAPRTLSDREAARYIGMSPSWLRQSRVSGSADVPPHLKIGRAVRYLRDDLDAWLESRRRTSTLGHSCSDIQPPPPSAGKTIR